MSNPSHPKTVGRKSPREEPLSPRAVCKAINVAYDERTSTEKKRKRGRSAGSAAAGTATRFKHLDDPWGDVT
jgi:hypothetical protein